MEANKYGLVMAGSIAVGITFTWVVASTLIPQEELEPTDLKI